MEENFSKWMKWENRNSMENINYPGIYCIAITDEPLENKSFSWIPEIKYIGMTNSKNGLKGRLKQFDNTINGKSGHGGADRFLYNHQDYKKLIPQLFVSVRFFKCDVSEITADNLHIMGDVAKCEYECFAKFVELYGKLPSYNDKPNSPKYSLTIARGKSSAIN